MVISCSTCQKEKKECKWVKYLIYAVLSRFQICRNLRVFFRQICIPKISEFTKKWLFSSLLMNNADRFNRLKFTFMNFMYSKGNYHFGFEYLYKTKKSLAGCGWIIFGVVWTLSKLHSTAALQQCKTEFS